MLQNTVLTYNFIISMNKQFLYTFIYFITLIPSPGLAEVFSANTAYSVCFTPAQNCTSEIVDALNAAHNSIYVQAYSFTSQPIANALVAAKKRGVQVNVILDKSQYKAEKYSASKFLNNQEVPVWIDFKPAIAHNKIMIIDGSTLITGSFNFTKAAQEKNAENLLIIHNAEIAKAYFNNWKLRQQQSTSLASYHPKRKCKTCQPALYSL